MKSQHAFNQVESVSHPRSQFDLSHPYKTTFDAGFLMPILDLPILPGDTISCNLDFFIRVTTQINPIMDNIWADTQFFFIPDRQILDNFRKMMGEQNNPGDSIDFVYPILDTTDTTIADPEADTSTATGRTSVLLDAIGVPTGISANDVDITSMTLRAINHCFNHWYRDQNFIDSLPVPTDDGPDDPADFQLFRRRKRHDYFTSCLPYPQKSNTPVSIPLGTSAPVEGLGMENINYTLTNQSVYETDTGSTSYPFAAQIDGGNNNLFVEGPAATGNPQIYTNLTAATASTVNDLREAVAIQQLLERDMRMGTRFPEVLRAHYGVNNFHDLTYRPLYLGGGSSPINVTPVAQTSTSTFGVAGDDVGNLSAFATMTSIQSNNHGFTQSFTEHGRVIAFISTRANNTYQHGLNRFLSKRTRYDVALPMLAHLGEQEILSKELYCDGTAGDEDVFGYNERYSEYRYMPGRISGLFRSQAVASLDPWHLSQDFASRPVLGQTFLEENPPIERVVQYTDEPQFIGDFYFNIKAARCLPTFGTPGLRHF